jgi:predicted nucleic acid-binding protein
MNDKVLFLDANCILEILFDRTNSFNISQKLEFYDKVFISMLSVHLVFHFGRKNGLNFQELDYFIEQFYILDFTAKNYNTARKIALNNDFEDALQLACAFDNGIRNILTLDQEMQKTYQNKFNFIKL